MSPFWLILVGALGDAPSAPAPIVIDYAMDSDPLLAEIATIKVFSEKYLPLWLQALDRPEADMQRLAAESVARTHAAGFAKMDKAKPALIRILAAKETQFAPRSTTARALIVLDAKEAAPQLWQAAQTGGLELRQSIEPALAHWKYEPAYAVWRKRLAGSDTGHRERMLAIRCLGEIADLDSAPQLLAIALDPLQPPAERLAAALAAGKTKDSGLEAEAQRLAPVERNMVERLCAVSLLERHGSEAARTILLTLAVDPEPSVASAALRRLNAIDTSLILPLAEKAMRSPDSGVRREGERCYAANPTLERIPAIAKLLDDPLPGLRAMVREDLRRLVGDSRWNDAVRQSAVEVLNAQGWRGQEQAALLLAVLDHKAAAPRLVKLLDSPRGEVMIASAWALKKLAVPETLPAMLQKASALTDVRLRKTSELIPHDLDHQVAHLFEAMAMMKYVPAEPLMKRYIPKNFDLGEDSRGAAIWGLGQLHLGKPDEALAVAISGRVTESPAAIPPEMPRIRLAGAFALGKMKAKSQAGALRAFLSQISPSKVFMALRWSLQEISGEEIPLPAPFLDSQGGWFLEPLDVQDLMVPK